MPPGRGVCPEDEGFFHSQGSFTASLIYFLSTRSVQFAVTLVLDVLIIYLLMRTGMFTRMGIWPPVSKEK